MTGSRELRGAGVIVRSTTSRGPNRNDSSAR